MKRKPDPTCPVVIALVAFGSYVAQQTAHQGTMDALVGGFGFVEPSAGFSQQGMELTMDLSPLAHAQRRKKVVADVLREPAIRFLVPDEFVVELPQLQQADEIGTLVAERRMAFVGGVRLVDRPLARILYGQGGRDDQYLAETVLTVRFQHHPADTRVDRQSREITTDARELRSSSTAPSSARSW